MNMVDRDNRARFEPVIGGSPEFFRIMVAQMNRSGENVPHQTYGAHELANNLGLSGLVFNNSTRH